MLIAFCITALAALTGVLFFRHRSASPSPHQKSVALVVLGDIGRSPRMLYHAQSFASAGYRTAIVAYRGSSPPRELAENPNVQFVYLATPLPFASGLPRPLFLLLAPFKVLLGACGLLYALMGRLDSLPRCLFVQNPPAIPTLPVVQLVALLRGTRVIIDWHNTGYSVLALRLGVEHKVVRIARFIEHFFGRTAYAHLCVSDAMKSQLTREAGLRGHILTLHDRPPSSFHRLSPSESSDLFSRLDFLSPSALNFPTSSASASSTTVDHPLAPGLLDPTSPDRPALLVSATSWTQDEDFSILLRALSKFETAARAAAAVGGNDKRLPRVVVVITGKGAGRAAFEREVEQLEKGWDWVRVRTAWLAREDYPRLLGAADLGISLHTSTSGIDLPMKVVDMFGCGLPVLALDFACLPELVKDRKNGRIFRDADEMAEQLMDLLPTLSAPYPNALALLRQGITTTRYGAPVNPKGGEEWSTWEENWERVVGGVL
ncbi:hypothetical protein JCM11641_006468 [Rhodosporidiobolus odoratus]